MSIIQAVIIVILFVVGIIMAIYGDGKVAANARSKPIMTRDSHVRGIGWLLILLSVIIFFA